MVNPATQEERKKFSERLQQSFYAAGMDGKSPTQIQRGFALLDPGTQVTIHAVRKWLFGQAIPTHKKLQMLANWLGVSASWLRFGEGAERPPAAMRSDSLRDHEVKLISQLRSLSPEDAMMVTKLVRRLASDK